MALLYGPAVRCKLDLMIWRRLVLRFCIRPLNGAFVLLAIMDIRAPSDLILGKAPEPLVPPDHGCDGETSSIQLADLGRYLSALLGGARTHWRVSFRVPAAPSAMKRMAYQILP
jgi:hypothetical protein